MFPCCFSWGVRAAAAPLAVLAGGVRAAAAPLAVVESVTARVGNGALHEVDLSVGQSCFRIDSEDTSQALQDERSVMSFLVRMAAVLIS